MILSQGGGGGGGGGGDTFANAKLESDCDIFGRKALLARIFVALPSQCP
jgi:hypothetical protein